MTQATAVYPQNFGYYNFVVMNNFVFEEPKPVIYNSYAYIENGVYYCATATQKGGFQYAYCNNNPLRFIDPTGLYSVDGIEDGTNYTVIAVFPTNYKEQNLGGDVSAAREAGMPMMFVDDVKDYADAMKGLSDRGSTTKEYALNSHGGNGNFDIGSDRIESGTDVSVLKGGLSNKTVFIGACSVAEGKEGQKFIQDFSKQTNSNVIASDHPLYVGYKYDGGNELNALGNGFYRSHNGFPAMKVTDVSIDKKTGINFNYRLMGIGSPIPYRR